MRQELVIDYYERRCQKCGTRWYIESFRSDNARCPHCSALKIKHLKRYALALRQQLDKRK